MQIHLSQKDLVEAIRSYTTKMIISKSELEISLPNEIPTTIILGDDISEDTPEPIENAKHPAKKPMKPKKPTKAQKAATDAAIAKLGIEPEVPNADDVEVPEVSEETANIIDQMEGKSDTKEAPTKKRMFGQ